MKKFKLKHLLLAIGGLVTFASCTTVAVGIADNIIRSNNSITNEDKVILTFDENGGTLTGNKTLSIAKTAAFSTLSSAIPNVTKEGVTGQPGWYITDPNNPVKSTDTFNQDTTLKANWKYYTVNYDANGGSWNGVTTKSFSDVTIVHADSVPVPYKPNTTFAGWKVNGEGDYKPFPHKPSALSPTTNSVTLKAIYSDKQNITIAFNSGEGAYPDSSKTKYIEVPNGSTWSTIKSKFDESNKNPDYDGKTKMFSEWLNNGSSINNETKFTSSSIVKAKYIESKQITFDANGGSWNGVATMNSKKHDVTGSTKPTFSVFKNDITTNPTKGTNTLIGWFKDIYANEEVIDTTSCDNIPDSVFAYYNEEHQVKLSSTSTHVTLNVVKYIRNEDNKIITITPDAGYKLKTATVSYDTNFTSDISPLTINEQTGVGTITINKAPGCDITVDVTPEAIEYNVANGTETSETNKFTTLNIPNKATFNTEVTVTAEGKPGYKPSKITIVTLKGETKDVDFKLSTGSTYTASFTMSYAMDITIKAYATAIDYTVTQGTHETGVKSGTVKINGATSLSNAHVDDTITVTATADTGFTLNQIEVSGEGFTETKSISSGTATFTMPAVDVVVKVTATRNNYTLKFNANVTGGKVPDSVSVAFEGSIYTAIQGKSASYDDGKFRGWGEVSTDENIITSDTIKMPAEEKTLYAKWNKYTFTFANPGHCTMSSTPTFTSQITLTSSDFSSLEINADNGYTFSNKFDIYYGDTKKIENFDFTTSNLAPGVNAALKDLDNGSSFTIKPVITANDGNIKFINNGGTIKKDGTTISSLVLKTDDLILDKFTENKITATHDYAKFNSWIIYTTDNPGGIVVNENTKMPYDGADIKPIWDTYNFEVTGVNASISGETSKTISNKIELHDQEEFTIAPNEGYMFDHYEYSFTKDGTYTTTTMPLRPYSKSQSITSGATIYVKAVCVKCNVVTIDGNGGTFTDGTTFKCINVKEGATWKDIKDTIPKPTKGSAIITKWTDGEGVELTDSTVLTDGFVIQPIWSA